MFSDKQRERGKGFGSRRVPNINLSAFQMDFLYRGIELDSFGQIDIGEKRGKRGRNRGRAG